jgi:hypothetical protein
MPSATFFKETADAFIRLGLKDAGYEYLQIDDCWMLAERGSEGQQLVDTSKFPDGIGALAAYVKRLGLSLGIYTAMGANTCAQKAGSCGAFKVDTAEYASWNLSYLKVDSCGGCTTPMNDTAIIRADLTATGRPFVMQVHPSTNITAVSEDPMRYGNLRIPGRDMFESWTSLVSAIDGAAGLWRFAHNDTGRGGFWNELDVLVGQGDFATDLPRIQSFFGMCVIMKSALILSTVVQFLSPEALAVVANHEAIAINQDALGVAGRRIASVPPLNKTMDAPFDALAVLARCNQSSPTQKWRLNNTDGTFWTMDAAGKRWCVGPSMLSWTRPLAVLPCDDAAYRDPNTTANCHVDTCNYVSGFKAAPVQCVGLPKPVRCAAPELGGVVGEGCTLHLKCKSGVISKIKFADFGTVGGQNSSCVSYESSATCTTENALQIVSDMCVGKQECEVLASAGVFGDPCRHVHKQLAIWAAGCAPDMSASDPEYSTFPSTTGALAIAWDNVEYGSGPLPHTRYIGGGEHYQGYWKVAVADLHTAAGAVLHAGYGSVRDDDGIGNVNWANASDFCLDAVRGGNLETWYAPLSGGRHALSLFNRSPSHDTITVLWEQLQGLDPLTQVRVRDVWRHQDLGMHLGSYSALVPAHGTALLVLTPVQ